MGISHDKLRQEGHLVGSGSQGQLLYAPTVRTQVDHRHLTHVLRQDGGEPAGEWGVGGRESVVTKGWGIVSQEPLKGSTGYSQYGGIGGH